MGREEGCCYGHLSLGACALQAQLMSYPIPGGLPLSYRRCTYRFMMLCWECSRTISSWQWCQALVWQWMFTAFQPMPG